ncbi:hypothetical protein [Fodinibius sp.]|uniref:hypothetical protein n=1 Tax=Fodinibius sp. TaxID=1872440 RepID=UPI002ACEF6AA|nr:hypothetical protein [Fodinibius sp.]MDZ7658010.1 hypothetical protein [Fodinibius sp.]
MYQFPDFNGKSVLATVREHWDLSHRVPLPTFDLKCPVCSHDKILCKHWVYFLRKNPYSSNPHRCDVYMKCTGCSAVWQHGLVVPKEMHPGQRLVILWREIKQELSKK